MSLINEALKKAQRMRHQDPAGTPPSAEPGGGQPMPPAAPLPLRRGRTPASQTLLLVAGVPLLVLVSVGLTWWMLRPTPADETPSIVRAELPAPAAPPAAAPSSGQAAATIEVQPAALPEPTAPVSAPGATSGPASSESAVPPASSPVVSGPAPAPTPSADSAEGGKPDPRVYAFLDTLRVSGIRASATDPRVSMNGRVFRLNDIVDRNLELRIIGIAAEGLTFIGPDGVVYQTQF